MADREVTYRLKVDAAGGSRALEDAARQAQRLETSADKAGKAVSAAARGGSGAGAGGGFSAQGALGGGFGAGVIPALSAGIAVQAIRGGIQFGSAAMQASADPSLTPWQRERQLQTSIPILGGLAKEWLEFVDLARGFTQRLQQVNRETQIALERIAAEAEASTEIRGNFRSLREIQGRAGASRDYLAFVRANPNASQSELGITQARLSAEDADRQRAEARQAFDDADAERRRLGASRSQLQAEVDALRRTAGTTPDTPNGLGIPGFFGQKPTRAQEVLSGIFAIPTAGASTLWGRPGSSGAQNSAAQLEFEAKRQKLAEVTAAHEDAIRKAKEAGTFSMAKELEYAAKSNAIAEATANLTREKVRDQTKLLEDERTRTATGAVAFGQLASHERLFTVEAAERARKQGLGALSDQDKQLLQRGGLFEKLIAELATKSAQSDPLFERALRAGGLRGMDAINKDLAKLPKAEVELAVSVNWQNEQLQKILFKIFDRLDQVILDAAKLREQKAANQALQGAAGGGK